MSLKNKFNKEVNKNSLKTTKEKFLAEAIKSDFTFKNKDKTKNIKILQGPRGPVGKGKQGPRGKQGPIGKGKQGIPGPIGKTPVISKANLKSIAKIVLKKEGANTKKEFEKILKEGISFNDLKDIPEIFNATKSGRGPGYLKEISDIDSKNFQAGYVLKVKADESGYEFVKDGFASFADDEVPSGLVDGSNTVFTLLNTPDTNSLKLFINGQRLMGGSEDYTLVVKTITLNVAPPATSIILSDYRY